MQLKSLLFVTFFCIQGLCATTHENIVKYLEYLEKYPLALGPKASYQNNEIEIIQDEQQIGSVGLKIAHIAQGGADLYIEPSPFTKAWDACAPEAILRGAGGCFTDIHGHPIQYGLDNFRNLHGLVGSTQDCYQRVIQTLTGLCSSCEG